MTMSPEPSPSTLARLGSAIARLGADGDFIAGALADFLNSLDPVRPNTLTPEQLDWLVESGALTRDELAEAVHDVARGALVAVELQTYLSFLRDTVDLNEAARALEVTPDEVTAAADAGELYVFTSAGQPRFPKWQFNHRAADGRLRGLPEVISMLSSLEWTSVQALMRTPQEDLVGIRPQTPAEWLQSGGDIASVREIVDAYRDGP